MWLFGIGDGSVLAFGRFDDPAAACLRLAPAEIGPQRRREPLAPRRLPVVLTRHDALNRLAAPAQLGYGPHRWMLW
jgi:hypothetical protein